MSKNCPDKSSRLWDELVRHTKGDTGLAYYIFDANGENIPNMYSYNYNDLTRMVSNKYNLLKWSTVDGERTSKIQGYIKPELDRIRQNILDNYLGEFEIKTVKSTYGEGAGLIVKGWPISKELIKANEDFNDQVFGEWTVKQENKVLQRKVEIAYMEQNYQASNEYVIPLSRYEQRPIDYIQHLAGRKPYVISTGTLHTVISPYTKERASFEASYEGSTLNVLQDRSKGLEQSINDFAKSKGFTKIRYQNIEEEQLVEYPTESIPEKSDMFEYQKKVLLKALPQVQEIVKDYSLDVSGVLEAGGKTIRVNPSIMSNDTLPHEFAHLLIDLRGGMKDEFIRRGRNKLKGSKVEERVHALYSEMLDSTDEAIREKLDKEVLATAVGEKAAELLEGNWLTRFVNWLSAKLGISNEEVYDLAKELVSEKEINPGTFTQEASEYLQEQRTLLDNAKSEEDINKIAELVKNLSNEIKFDKETHTYFLKGKALTAVSTLMAQYDYGISKEDENPAIIRGQKIGTTVHENAESLVTQSSDMMYTKTGFEFNTRSRADLKAIITELYGDKYLLLPEVVVVHESAELAGTIDMLAIDKSTGAITMFDYKAKEKFGSKGEKNGFKYYDSTTFTNSQRMTNTIQLSMYKQILKDSLGLEVEDLFIVPIVADVNANNKVMSVELWEGSTIELSYNPVVKKMIKERKQRIKEDALFAEEFAERLESSLADVESNKEFFKNREMMNKSLTGYEKLYDEALDLLTVRYREAKAKKDVKAINNLRPLIEKIKSLESKKGVLAFAVEAIDDINDTYENYINRKKRWDKGDKTAFTPRQLINWYQNMSGYEVLNSISKEFLSSTYQGEGSTSKAIQLTLLQAIAKKDKIQDIYKEVGKPIIIGLLAPYSSRMLAEYREVKQREYLALPKDKRGGKTMKQYVDEFMVENKAILEERIEINLNSELDVASEDIGLIYRWLDNLLDSNDAVIAALVKKYVIKSEVTRQEDLTIKDDLVRTVRKLEEFYSYNSADAIETIYDFMLEKDDKKEYTGHIVTKFSSDLLAAEDKMMKESENLEESRRREVRREWRKENMPMRTSEFEAALATFLNKLLTEGNITPKQLEEYNKNQDIPYAYREADLKKVVGNEAAGFILEWVVENSRDYRDPNSKWESKQYKDLKKILTNKQDPRTLMYNMLVELGISADEMLPSSVALRGQLPSIAKSATEKYQSGLGFVEAAKTTFNMGLTKHEDDTDKGVITNRNDKPIDSVPIYFQRTENWSSDNQSYDLASIYYRYAKMANNYKTKNELLGEMELTKLFVENREYIVTDPKGNPIKKIMDSFKQKSLTKSGKNSLLAEQLADWLQTELYGKAKMDEGEVNLFGYKIDKAKAADLIGRYTSLNLLGLNMVQGIANVNFGELQQAIEAMAAEYFNANELTKASKIYFKNLPAMASEWGSRTRDNWVSKLLEQENILNDYDDVNFKSNNRFMQNFNTSVLFAQAHAGEHFMQSRVMLAMLLKVEAKDSKGVVIGNMAEMYSVNRANGRLEIDKRVDLVKSNWTQEESIAHFQKTKRLLSRLHGEYSDVGKSAAQRYMLGRLGIMFRKFLIPGFKKRWDKKKYNEFLENYTEGDYRNTGNFIKNIFLDLIALRTSLVSEQWGQLLPREKANVIRAVSEVSFSIALAILSTIFLSAAGDADDDKKKLLYNHLAYLTSRTRTEAMAFINPSEMINLLRSPAAAMMPLENLIKLVGQMMPPSFKGFDEYQNGNWKGHYKINKTIMKLTPGVKQYYRITDIDDIVNIFNK